MLPTLNDDMRQLSPRGYKSDEDTDRSLSCTRSWLNANPVTGPPLPPTPEEQDELQETTEEA